MDHDKRFETHSCQFLADFDWLVMLMSCYTRCLDVETWRHLWLATDRPITLVHVRRVKLYTVLVHASITIVVYSCYTLYMSKIDQYLIELLSHMVHVLQVNSACTCTCSHMHACTDIWFLFGVPKHMMGSPYYYCDRDLGPSFPRGPQNFMTLPWSFPPRIEWPPVTPLG